MTYLCEGKSSIKSIVCSKNNYTPVSTYNNHLWVMRGSTLRKKISKTQRLPSIFGDTEQHPQMMFHSSPWPLKMDFRVAFNCGRNKRTYRCDRLSTYCDYLLRLEREREKLLTTWLPSIYDPRGTIRRTASEPANPSQGPVFSERLSEGRLGSTPAYLLVLGD